MRAAINHKHMATTSFFFTEAASTLIQWGHYITKQSWLNRKEKMQYNSKLIS